MGKRVQSLPGVQYRGEERRAQATRPEEESDVLAVLGSDDGAPDPGDDSGVLRPVEGAVDLQEVQRSALRERPDRSRHRGDDPAPEWDLRRRSRGGPRLSLGSLRSAEQARAALAPKTIRSRRSPRWRSPLTKSDTRSSMRRDMRPSRCARPSSPSRTSGPASRGSSSSGDSSSPRASASRA